MLQDLNNLLTLEKADDEKAAARVSSLEATVQALEAKLLSAEESYKKRLDAETELLNSQLHDLQSKLSSEHVMSTELQEQLGRREYQLGVLQEKVKYADFCSCRTIQSCFSISMLYQLSFIFLNSTSALCRNQR